MNELCSYFYEIVTKEFNHGFDACKFWKKKKKFGFLQTVVIKWAFIVINHVLSIRKCFFFLCCLFIKIWFQTNLLRIQKSKILSECKLWKEKKNCHQLVFSFQIIPYNSFLICITNLWSSTYMLYPLLSKIIIFTKIINVVKLR